MQPAHGGGQRWVHCGPRGEMIFFKVVPTPLGMLKQLFLALLELVVTRLGPWKIPKSLETGPFEHQKWVKNGSKTHFPKSDPRPSGMLKQVVLPHFEPIGTLLGPRNIAICFQKGRFREQNWANNVSKTRFFLKLTLDLWGCINRCFKLTLSPF